MVDADAVRFEHAGKLGCGDHAPEVRGAFCLDGSRVRARGVLGDRDAQALAEVGFGEGEEGGAAKVEAEDENGHGDRDLRVGDEVLHRYKGLE